jgi:NADH-quinone oxidoreductase subunit E
MSEPIAFSVATNAKIAELVGRYPRKQGALIPTLYLAQDEFGWLKPDVMQLVADTLELPLASVLATAMFYTMLHKKPVGRFQVQVCTNVSCYLLGSDDLMAVASEVLGIAPGETTADGLFTLESVQCLCACDRAPALQINKEDKFNLTPVKFRDMLEQLKNEGVRLGPPVGWPLSSHA